MIHIDNHKYFFFNYQTSISLQSSRKTIRGQTIPNMAGDRNGPFRLILERLMIMMITKNTRQYISNSKDCKHSKALVEGPLQGSAKH